MEGTLSLKIIQENVKTCKKCNLCDTRRNAVPGKGNQKADVVFIGEAPGKNEDLHGEPFIGGTDDAFLIKYNAAGSREWTRVIGSKYTTDGIDYSIFDSDQGISAGLQID